MSEHVWTGLDFSEQVVTCRYIFGHVWTCRTSTDMSGKVGTVLDSSRQFWYRSRHVWICWDRSLQVGIYRYRTFGTGRTCRDRSAQVWTRRENSGAGRDVCGHVGACWDRSLQVRAFQIMSGQIGSGGEMSGQVVRTGRFCSGKVWTRLDRSEQVVTGRDMFGHVCTCRNKSVHFGICWYRSFGRGRT
jgi:hypothetical protein